MKTAFAIPTPENSNVCFQLFVGNTPLRKCSYLSDIFNTNVFIKEEFHNLGMSSKDRPALFMIQDAIQNNKITPGGTFVEASSGNTGVSIALMAKQFGYSCRIFISKLTSKEKVNLLTNAGAIVEICDNSNGLSDCNSTQFKAQAYAAEHPDTYFTNQYNNPQNIRAHYTTTGPEIWKQSGGQITHFIAGIGTGGTLTGIGKFLKENNHNIKIWGIEPNGSVLTHYLATGKVPEKKPCFEPIEGIGRNFIPGSFDPAYVDAVFQIGLEESRQMARIYRANAGLLTGFSSAAVIASLKKHRDQMKLTPADYVVLLFPDHGSRYLSKLYMEADQ